MVGVAKSIRLVEVGPRDGLQNEKEIVPTEAKAAFVDALSETGVQEIEAGAFVSPKALPQLADSEEVFRRIRRKPGVLYSALVPNEKGLDRALKAGAQKVAVFTAASETFNRRNIRATIAESLERFRPVARRAKEAGLPLRGYVSTAFHCPFEGPIDPSKVLAVVRELFALGVDEVSVGDTIGKASPDEVRRLLESLLKEAPGEKTYLHLHDTYGRAVENALTAWREFGVTGYDASVGGLGGCPYAPGASGNVATERLLGAFERAGADVPARPEAFEAASKVIAPHLKRPPLKPVKEPS